ncbi:hypothetical protein LG198_01265 [Methylobacillus arboreus]|uniref:protein YgfX n=1 Tax=Methylobacillus arboreus TaxID=755170 RepID=UPI001E2C4CCE|nr:protein YgfX [Methylobacillus arboreus]MCB5189358.1 hypothetical protein [Methylobacillus arboreus]
MQKTQYHYSVKTATLILEPSRWLACLFVLMGMVAGFAIMLLPWPWWLKAMLLPCIIAVTAWHIWRDARRRHPASPVMIELNHEGKLWLTMRNDTRHTAEVRSSSLVTPSLTVLNLKLDHGKATCLIVPDSVDPDEFRRLRVWLRWGVHEDMDGSRV